MDVHSENIPVQSRSLEIDLLRSELEQARVTLEDMDQRIAELEAVNAELQQRLTGEIHKRGQAERELRDLAASAVVAPATPSEDDTLRLQLSTALEELHVMAEELSLAQDALRAATLQR